MPIIIKSNKKAKRVSFALNDETQYLEMENKNLAQQIGAKLSFNEDLNKCYYNLHKRANKELKEMIARENTI
ncbi:hypothetical protein MHK_010369 [Candidatus Magnetomorum sp. HK-1]|nr:hypothetical protein MHK_010369 [Candidatus Magnetomorum sp. HK-1]